MKRRNWRKIGILSLILFLVLPISVGVAKIGNFYIFLDRFSFNVQTGNAPKAKEELDNLRSFYSGVAKWKLGGLAGKTIFRDQNLYEGAYLYLIGDYKETENILSNISDYRAYHIRGSAGFRLAKGIYETRRGAIYVDQISENSRDNFELALRNGPDDNFDDKWNYDLMSDPRSRNRAFASSGSRPRVILGFNPNDPQNELAPQSGNDDRRELPQGKSRPGESGSVKKRP